MSQQIKNFIYPPILALILASGFVFVYQVFFAKTEIPPASLYQSAQIENRIINPNFNLKIFQDERFKALKFYGKQ